MCSDKCCRNCNFRSSANFYNDSERQKHTHVMRKKGCTYSSDLLDSNPSKVDKRQRTSAALLPVLGPSLSKTLGRRDGAVGLLVLLVVVVLLLLLSDMVLEFSTVTFRLILDILQDWSGDKKCKGWQSDSNRCIKKGLISRSACCCTQFLKSGACQRSKGWIQLISREFTHTQDTHIIVRKHVLTLHLGPESRKYPQIFKQGVFTCCAVWLPGIHSFKLQS